jgi:hypothetical protein
MVYEEFETYSVDTPEDLMKVERCFAQGLMDISYANSGDDPKLTKEPMEPLTENKVV